MRTFILTAFITANLLPGLAFSATNAQTFTYQGRFLNAAGTAPLLDTVDLVFSIYDPAGACLLYEEVQNNINLIPTAGAFSSPIGSLMNAAKRSGRDPDLTMAQVFANGAAATRGAGANCAGGYTPSAGDARILRVTVTPHSTSTATTLSDLTLNSVPQAQIAETIQGLAPADFIQSAAGIAAQGNVSLVNLKSLTDGTSDASALHNHDGRYVTKGGAAATNLGSTAYTSGDNFGIGTTTAVGNLDFIGSSGSQLIDVQRNTTGNASGAGLALQAGGASTGATNKSGGTLTLSSGTSTGSAGSGISFQTSAAGAAGAADNALSTKMSLTSDGRLEVGTGAPGAQLEVDTSGVNEIGAIIKGFAGQVADLFQVQNNAGTVVAKIAKDGTMTLNGPLNLPADPGSNLQAATKQYVDNAVTGATAGVATFNTRNGAVTLSSTDVTDALAYTPLKNVTDTLTGDLSVTGAVNSATLSCGGVPPAHIQFQSTSTAANNIGEVIKAFNGQTADLLELQDHTGAVLSKFDSAGVLTLAVDPTSNFQAATKEYVDNAISSGAVDWTKPGTIGSVTPNTGSFTTLAASGNASVTGNLSIGAPATAGGNLEIKGINSNIVLWNTNDASFGTIENTYGSVYTIMGSAYFSVGSKTGTHTGGLGSTFRNVIDDGAGNMGIGTETPVSSLNITTAPVAGAGLGTLSLGEGGWTAGNPTHFVGSANGTEIAVNSAGGFTGNLIDLQKGGVSQFKVTNAGAVTAASFVGDGSGLTNIGSGAVNWTTPGTIGSGTPNTAVFTTLNTSGATVLKGATSDNSAASLNATNAANTSLLFVRNDGNVGVGTAAPAYRLDVSGNTNVSGSYLIGGVTMLAQPGSASNLAIGSNTLTAATAGSSGNIAIGQNALMSNTVGGANMAIGPNALVNNVSGVNNTAVGPSALAFTNSNGNTGIGFQAGSAITSGTANTVIGYSVGLTTLKSGSNNILIGNSSSVDTPAAATSNYLNIGNVLFATGMTGTVAAPAGNVGIGVQPSTNRLEVSGTVSATSFTGDGSGLTNVPASAVSYSMAYASLTDGGTVTWPVAGLTNNAVVTLGGNRALAFSGLTNGMSGTLIVKQDGSGSRTLTLPAQCTNKVIGGGSGAVALTGAANGIDILTFTYDGTNCYWAYGKNYN